MRMSNGRLFVGAVGLLVVAAGVAALLTGAHTFGSAAARDQLIDADVRRWWNEGGAWSFLIAAGAGIVLLLVGLGIVFGALRPPRGPATPRSLELQTRTDTEAGGTSVRSGALGDAVAAHLGAVPDVLAVKAEVTGHHPRLGLRATVTVGDGIDLATLPDRLHEAVDRFASTTGVQPEPVAVTLRFRAAARQRSLQ